MLQATGRLFQAPSRNNMSNKQLTTALAILVVIMIALGALDQSADGQYAATAKGAASGNSGNSGNAGGSAGNNGKTQTASSATYEAPTAVTFSNEVAAQGGGEEIGDEAVIPTSIPKKPRFWVLSDEEIDRLLPAR
jgi:hypothetical protein